MGLLLGLFLQGWSWAAVPLELPATEVPSEWIPLLGLGDLYLSPAAGSRWVRIEESDGRWIILVHDESGQMHDLILDIPQNMRDREEIIVLASSLLESSSNRDLPTLQEEERVRSTLSALPPLPALPPVVAVENPVSPLDLEPEPVVDLELEPVVDPVVVLELERVEEPVVTPEVERVEALELEPVADVTSDSDLNVISDSEVLSTTPVSESSSSIGVMNDLVAWSVRLSGDLDWRPQLSPTAALSLGAIRTKGNHHMSGVLRHVSRKPLTIMTGTRSVDSTSLFWGLGTSRSQFLLELGLGVVLHHFQDASTRATQNIWMWTPAISSGLDVAVLDRGPFSLKIGARIGREFRQAHLRENEEEQSTLSPWSASMGLSFGWI